MRTGSHAAPSRQRTPYLSFFMSCLELLASPLGVNSVAIVGTLQGGARERRGMRRPPRIIMGSPQLLAHLESDLQRVDPAHGQVRRP